MVKRSRKRNLRRTFIKEWRLFRNLSQERLAERINRTVGLISQIENGKGPYTQETLEALAGALGCEPVDLLIRNPMDPEGIWSIWEGLEPVQKRQAIDILKVMSRKAS